jgi:hypothetical protein
MVLNELSSADKKFQQVKCGIEFVVGTKMLQAEYLQGECDILNVRINRGLQIIEESCMSEREPWCENSIIALWRGVTGLINYMFCLFYVTFPLLGFRFYKDKTEA